MGDLVENIKAIKDSADYYYKSCDIYDDRDKSKYKEYLFRINAYKRAVKWMRMFNIEIDDTIK